MIYTTVLTRCNRARWADCPKKDDGCEPTEGSPSINVNVRLG